MDPQHAIKRMVDASGRSASDVSRSIGKSRSYLSVLQKQGSDPRTKNLARIAHECGYRLVLRNDDTGDEIELYDKNDTEQFLESSMSGEKRPQRLSETIELLLDPRAAYRGDMLPDMSTPEEKQASTQEHRLTPDDLKELMRGLKSSNMDLEFDDKGHFKLVEFGSEKEIHRSESHNDDAKNQ